MKTKDQAVDSLMHCSQVDLYESVQEMHKDQYGTRGRHMSRYTVSELVNWWISHYDWDQQTQCWVSNTSFDNDDCDDYLDAEVRYQEMYAWGD